MITYSATLDVLTDTATLLTDLLIAERRRRGTGIGARAAICRTQALLVLRWFREDTGMPTLARDAGVSQATGYRYLQEGIDVLAARAPDLHSALEQGKAAGWSHVVLDGTLNLDLNNMAGGVIADDFNNDGYLDIVTSSWDLDVGLHFFESNGDGTFTDRSKDSGLSDLTGGLNLLQTDFNNDGLKDIFVLRGAWLRADYGLQPNSLIKNNGDGTFTGQNAGAMGSMDIENGKIDGNSLTWTMNMTVPMPMTLEGSATIEGDQLTEHWAVRDDLRVDVMLTEEGVMWERR